MVVVKVMASVGVWGYRQVNDCMRMVFDFVDLVNCLLSFAENR
jgi:hypothetical protein